MDIQPSKELVLQWVARARDDELSCKSILRGRDGAPNTVCFLSQQLAEKILKSFLIFKNREFPKIHQLDALVKICGEVDKTFENIKEEAGFLTTFYTTARYPGDYPEFSWKNAEDAFSAAEKIKSFVLDKID